MDEGQSDGIRRRLRRRGGSGGMAFSGGGLSDSSVAEGAPAVSEDEDINAAVAAAAAAQPRRIPVNPASQIPALQDDVPMQSSVRNMEEFTPANRLAEVRNRSSAYEREYRLMLLHRMLMRNLPLDEVAAQLGISIRQVQEDRKELASRLRETAKGLDIEMIIGDSKGFYEEVQAMAMRAASSSQVPMPMRLAAMRTALAANNDKHRFYQAAGVYDVLRFKKGQGEGAQTDIQRLLSLTEDLLSERRRDNRPANPLGEFSGDDRENMEL